MNHCEEQKALDSGSFVNSIKHLQCSRLFQRTEAEGTFSYVLCRARERHYKKTTDQYTS